MGRGNSIYFNVVCFLQFEDILLSGWAEVNQGTRNIVQDNVSILPMKSDYKNKRVENSTHPTCPLAQAYGFLVDNQRKEMKVNWTFSLGFAPSANCHSYLKICQKCFPEFDKNVAAFPFLSHCTSTARNICTIHMFIIKLMSVPFGQHESVSILPMILDYKIRVLKILFQSGFEVT